MKNSIYSFLAVAFLTLGCENEDITQPSGKLDYYVESYDLDGLGEFTPHYKVTYQYDHNKILRYTFFGYSADLKSYEKQRYFDFAYVEGRVDKIKGYLAGASSPYIEYTYQYLSDSRVSKITEDNDGTGITSEANFAYNDTDEKVKVSYTYSNGGSFEYEFNYGTKNILNDKTTRGDQLCSDGVYTYDKNKNPFNELGYIDYTLNNISANNKLTEDVNYVGCAFPSIIPESYTYEYNNNGYPTKAITLFSSGSKSEKKFFYRK